MSQFSNRLARESSPYLLQHAHNPVDWYPWGDEAFDKARMEDKPVLVSIGYAACHWCHVMERESFEDEETAALMNEHFVNIKVDREERPDIDHIYMDAVQAISGSGGWPLNVFLLPDKRPFYGGTYFPPKRAFNRSSWKEVLTAISNAYRKQKAELETQAGQLTDHLRTSNDFRFKVEPEEGSFQQDKIDQAFENIMKTADRKWGGFGNAPKFPQTFTISFLLQYAHLLKNKDAEKQALISLDKMSQGGIYDHIGGGFARYSTDTEWLVPHFEKMLYDNALLVSILSEAYQYTGSQSYRDTIEETLAFIEREMMHEKGGYYSALDADSEGVEGKFYIWSHEEVANVIGKDAEVFCRYFDITPGGNWEGNNIPRIKKTAEEFAASEGIELVRLQELISKGKQLLLKKRSERIRPLLDDKILLGWNALMNQAYSKAYAATGNEHYREMAERNMDFLLKNFKLNDQQFFHTWKNEVASQPAFLDDLSLLIAALIELSQVTANYQWLDQAREITTMVINSFGDEESPFFFYTNRDQQDVLLRKKEIYDGATPSGNSVMAYNLYRLSILFDQSGWRERAEAMTRTMAGASMKYPTSFGLWLTLIFEISRGTAEIAILGNEWKNTLVNLLGKYISHKLAMASARPLEQYPLLADKAETSEIHIYLCKNYECKRPVSTIRELISIL